MSNIDTIRRAIEAKWTQLQDIDDKYLSAYGKAAEQAYRTALYHLSSYDDLESIVKNRVFERLLSYTDKHTEFYNVLHRIYRAILSALYNEYRSPNYTVDHPNKEVSAYEEIPIRSRRCY